MENVANRVVLIRQETYERREVRGRIERIIDELGGANRFFRPGMRVLLKPNLLAAAAPERLPHEIKPFYVRDSDATLALNHA